MADFVKIFEIKLDADEYLNELEKLQKEIIRLRERQKELKKLGEETSKEFVENAAKLKSLRQVYRDLEKALTAKNRAEKEHVDLIARLNEELKKEATSINEIIAQNRLLNRLKRDLNVNNAEELALLDEVNKRISENVERRRALEDTDTKRIMNIGRYKESIETVLPLEVEWVDKTKAIISATKQFIASNVTATNGVMKFGQYLKALAKIGVVGILTAIIYVISKLGRALKNNFGVVEKWRKIWYPIREVFKSITGAIVDFVDNGMDYLTKFGDFLKDVWSGNWVEAGRKAKVFFDGIKNGVNEAVETGSKLADLDNYLDKINASLSYNLSVLNVELAKVNAKLNDSNLSVEKRISLMRKAFELEKKKLDIEKNAVAVALEKARIEARGGGIAETKKMLELQARMNELRAKEIKLADEFTDKMRELRREAVKKRYEEMAMMMERERELIEERYKLEEAKTEEQIKMMLKKWVEFIEKRKALLTKGKDMGAITEEEYKFEVDKLNILYEKLKEVATEKERELEIAKMEAKKEAREWVLNILAEGGDTDAIAELERMKMEEELERLKELYNKKLIAVEEYEEAKEAIVLKHEKAIAEATKKLNKEVEKSEMDKFEMAKGLWNAGKNLAEAFFKDNKDMQIALTIIDTLASAVMAYKSQFKPVADVTSPVRGALAAASAIAQGMARVEAMRKITPRGGGGGGIGTFNLPTSVGSTATAVARETTEAVGDAGNVVRGGEARVRVYNVARETAEVYEDEIFVENISGV